MSTSRALGAEKPATKHPRSYMEGPRGGKASCKKSKKMYMVAASPKRGRRGARARAPAPPPRPSSRASALCACGILSTYLSIYIYLSIPLHIYKTYISLSLSLSLSLFLSRSSFWEGLGGRTCALRSCSNSKTSKRV